MCQGLGVSLLANAREPYGSSAAGNAEPGKKPNAKLAAVLMELVLMLGVFPGESLNLLADAAMRRENDNQSRIIRLPAHRCEVLRTFGASN